MTLAVTCDVAQQVTGETRPEVVAQVSAWLDDAGPKAVAWYQEARHRRSKISSPQYAGPVRSVSDLPVTGSCLAFCYCFLAGSVFPLGSGLSSGRYPFGKDNEMPSINIATPVSSAPTDRLALGVGWVRPGVAGIGGTLNPSRATPYKTPLCFEGNEE